MPIYTYECPEHGEFDRYFASWRDKTETSICECGAVGEYIISSPNICPDTFWAGKSTDYGYFTSRSAFNRTLKEKGIARYESGMDQDIKRNKKHRLEKQERELHKVVVDTVKDF